MAAPPNSTTEPGRSRPRLPWQAWVAATVLALTAAGLVLVVASGSGDGSDRSVSAGGSTAPGVGLRPADEVPAGDPLDIEFTRPDDTTATLREQLDGRPMVVNFFAAWCPPCIKEMPDFDAVSRQLASQVDFFGLAIDRPEDAAEIVDETGITYPWALDSLGDIAGAAQVVQMPTTMFVAADGTVEEIHAGALDRDELRARIAEHLGVRA